MRRATPRSLAARPRQALEEAQPLAWPRSVVVAARAVGAAEPGAPGKAERTAKAVRAPSLAKPVRVKVAKVKVAPAKAEKPLAAKGEKVKAAKVKAV